MCGVVILTTVDIFQLEFISIRFTTFLTSTKISNTKKHQISAYRWFENVSLLYIYCQWVAATTLRTKLYKLYLQYCDSSPEEASCCVGENLTRNVFLIVCVKPICIYGLRTKFPLITSKKCARCLRHHETL